MNKVSHKCLICNRKFVYNRNDYMLKHDLWLSIAGSFDGFIHIKCIEKHLNRKLQVNDLLECFSNVRLCKYTKKIMKDTQYSKDVHEVYEKVKKGELKL